MVDFNKYINKYMPGNQDLFMAKVRTISASLQIDPIWLLSCMYLESNINPQAVNKMGGATGLIQFMPSTAKNLGTTVEQLYQMSGVQQLDYVYKYLKPYAGRMKQLTDVYLAIFFPIAIGKPDSYILQSGSQSASLIAKYNAGYDLNKDQKITISEIKSAIFPRLGLAYTQPGGSTPGLPGGSIQPIKKKCNIFGDCSFARWCGGNNNN